MKFLKLFSKFVLNNKSIYTENCGKYVNQVRLNSYNIDLKIDNISLNKYIASLEEEYRSLKTRQDSTNQSRLSELQPVINILERRKEIVDNLVNVTELLAEKDAEMRKLAEEEKTVFESQIQNMDELLKEVVLPVDTYDDINAIVLEVNAGVGGQEAMLFASEMLNMYTNYIVYKKWEYEIAEYLTTDIGGLRHASLLVNGDQAFRCLKYEAGVHRVQRIPTTEKAGRIHTSTVSVLCLPQPTDIQINLDSKDLKFETKRASGAGGQHVNTTDSAVRVVHLPTGLAVECQTDRSQIKNRQIALQRLRAKIYERQWDAQQAEVLATKRSQVKSNFRNEKIRTYNFNQDRITDHRLSSFNVHNLKVFMMGGEPLEGLINKLDLGTRIERLREIVERVS